MFKKPLCFVAGICIGAGAYAQGLRPLDDGELSKVSGKDGVGIMMDLQLNMTTLNDPNANSHIALGFKGADGKTNYIVVKNPRGALFTGVAIDVKKRTDGGGDYVSLKLPSDAVFSNFGFESLNAQDNPATIVPFNQTLGGLKIDGKMSMTGELRLWSH
ncbi:MAG TPA: DUF6160 family protein [Noviherbaspirillum sp.]|nr:DUF6160 family protein [Noviherbaspirillum sp.]